MPFVLSTIYSCSTLLKNLKRHIYVYIMLHCSSFVTLAQNSEVLMGILKAS